MVAVYLFVCMETLEKGETESVEYIDQKSLCHLPQMKEEVPQENGLS